MIDKELEEKLDLVERRIHERFDDIHLRHKRIENYLAAVLGLIILLIGLVSYSWFLPHQP